MPENIFVFDCPCCSKRIEFDVRSRKARAVKVTEAKVKQDFDALLSDQSLERKRLDGAFGQALDAQRKEKDTLDDMFRTAKEKAKEDGDDKPFRPFDLD
jgi:hypothetical protein